MRRGIRAEYRRDNANRPHAIHPNDTNHPTHNPRKRYQPLHAICPNEAVGAVPACPPERPLRDVSIPKNTRMVRRE